MNDDVKTACVQRFSRTIKTRMFRYCTHHRMNRWIDVLDDLIFSYNASFHRSIGMAPIDDITTENEDLVIRRLYPEKPVPQ
jgi:hypothetical protein